MNLKKKRDKLVKPKIENKDTKFFKVRPEESISSFINKLEDTIPEEEDTKSDVHLFKEQAIRLSKHFEENQQFSSRRRKEFEELVKRPLFTDTKIRVRFPDMTIMEAKFSPKESLKDVVDFVRAQLLYPEDSFYLYQSPPIQKVTQYHWHKSLDEAECVPSALFYFALDDKTKETPDKIYVKVKI